MSEYTGVGVASRIKGQPAIMRSVTLVRKAVARLVIKVDRYGNHRARTDAERMWAAKLAAALGMVLTMLVDVEAEPMTNAAEVRRTIAYKSGGPR